MIATICDRCGKAIDEDQEPEAYEMKVLGRNIGDKKPMRDIHNDDFKKDFWEVKKNG